MTNEKILDKLGKIKAHMESAQNIGNEQEAQAFAAMLQNLLIKHKLEMTDIEYSNEVKEEPVEEYEVGGGTNRVEVGTEKRVYSVTELAKLSYKDLPPKVRRFLEKDAILENEEEWKAKYDKATEKERYEMLYHECGVGMRDFPFSKWYSGSQHKYKRFYKNYPDVEIRRQRISWIEELAAVVAEAHSCRIMVSQGSSRIWLVGHKSNVQVAEYIFITMQRAAEKISIKEYSKYFDAMQEAGMVEKARGFRASFLDGFVRRLMQRFEEEKRKMEGGHSSTALVRLNKEAIAVRQYLDAKKKQRKASSLSGNNSFNAEGYKRGKEVADSLRMDANAVQAGQPNKQLQ